MKKIFSIFLLFIFTVKDLIAGTLAPGITTFKFLLNFYKQDSNAGNQVFDGSKVEDATAFEPMVFVSHQIDEKTNVSGHFVFDMWTAESDTRLDGNTGQSGEGIGTQKRGAGTISVLRETIFNKQSFGLGISNEYDYRSFNLNYNFSKEFAQRNFTLSLGVKYFQDAVKVYNFAEQTLTPYHTRTVLATNIGASQILTRSDIVYFGYDYIELKGKLDSTASFVFVNGVVQNEVMPNIRKRHAFNTKWVHGFNDKMALNLSYRFYNDEWKLEAHTIKPALLFTLFDEEGLLELSYRFHKQSKASFYQDSFTSTSKYMTSDSDLEKFDSNEYGVHFSRNFGEKKMFGKNLEDWTWTAATYYSKRSNDMKTMIVQTGIGAQF